MLLRQARSAGAPKKSTTRSLYFGTSADTQQWAQPFTAGVQALAARNVNWRLWNKLEPIQCVYRVPITYCLETDISSTEFFTLSGGCTKLKAL